jgi:DNA primase catalytic subunit
MSVLNWLMPERVGEKKASDGAYPIGGEYVVDIDSYLNYQSHKHKTTEDGVCKGCLINSKELTERFLDEISENYSGIRVVFSVKAGFHIHVLDFDVRDWSSYNERSPLKSHEVARFLYTKHLNESVGGYDRHHFVVSSDVMRVITFPESLNGSTGMICSSLSNSAEFSRLGVDEILESARKARGIIQGVNFTPLDRLRVPSRLEPHRDGVVIWSQILCGGAEARR